MRSAIRPWPTQATKSWFMTWLSSQRPVTGSATGAVQHGIRSCSNGSSPGSGSMNQPTLSVFSSSIGTRHSKWPVYRQLGHRHTRPVVQSGSSSVVSSRMRRYTKP